jgi:hypothetical protein
LTGSAGELQGRTGNRSGRLAVSRLLAAADERRREGRPSLGGFDDIEPIDIEAALAQSVEEDELT